MHLSKVTIVNYRNFSSTRFLFSTGINTIIGENGSGKTNLFRAIRLLLDNSMRRSAMRLHDNDFFRGLDDWRGHWIIISLEFSEVSQDESIQSLFLHGTGNIDSELQLVDRATYNLVFRPNIEIRTRLSTLAPGDSLGLQRVRRSISIDDYETIITGKSSADFDDPLVYQSIVGNFQDVVFPSEMHNSIIGGRVPPILSMSNEVAFTFVQALRDVVSEFHNNRTNPLFKLLRDKSHELNQEEFQPIVNQVDTLNTSIESLSDVKEVRADIKQTVNDTVGDAYSPNSLSIKSDLSNEAEEIFQSLKLFIAETNDGHEGAIHEMSLGGANLIYLTLKLLEFKYQGKNRPIANFLLIEEPEAHIHTHIQKSLFDGINYPDTQVIYSTHSSHISEISNIKNVNIVGKVNSSYEAFQPSIGLSDHQIGRVQRYLDAIRSNLLFAKSVILVEGDAEEILIPKLVKEVLGVSLDELGISLVNIRSTGFENIAILFNDNRIRKKCSIITDLDLRFFDTTELANDNEAEIKAKRKALASETAGLARRDALNNFCEMNQWVNVYFATHTFEVDLITAGNKELYVSTVGDVYSDPNTIQTAIAELRSNDIAIFGKRALTLANYSGKGWYAITLGNYLNYNSYIPQYILDAVVFAHNTFAKDVIDKILDYRVNKIDAYLVNQRNHVVAAQNQEPDWYSDWDNYLTPREQAFPILRAHIEGYRLGTVNIDSVRESFSTFFPDDGINLVLSRIV